MIIKEKKLIKLTVKIKTKETQRKISRISNTYLREKIFNKFTEEKKKKEEEEEIP